MFDIFRESFVSLLFPYNNNISPLCVVGSKLKEFLTNYDLESALNLIIPFTEELIKRYKEIEGKQVVKRLQNLKKYMESQNDEFLLRCVITDTRYDIIKKALNKANKHFDTELRTENILNKILNFNEILSEKESEIERNELISQSD